MFTLLSWYYYTSELKPCRRKIDPRCLIQINNLHCYTIFCFASYCAVLFVCFIVYSIRRIVIPKSELEYWIVCRITMAQSFMGTTVALRDADFHIRCDFCSICVQSTLPLFYVNPANIVLLSVLRKCIRLNGILWLLCNIGFACSSVAVVLFAPLYNCKRMLNLLYLFLSERFVFSCDYTLQSVRISSDSVEYKTWNSNVALIGYTFCYSIEMWTFHVREQQMVLRLRTAISNR